MTIGEEDGFSYIRGVLSQLGYKRDSARQKKRTKFKVGDCFVEYNLGPIGKPWMEIEGPTKAEILETLTKMGFAETDITRISDKQNYIRQGFKEKDIENLRFKPNGKN